MHEAPGLDNVNTVCKTHKKECFDAELQTRKQTGLLQHFWATLYSFC